LIETFAPAFRVIDQMEVFPLKQNIVGETMLYQADVPFAYEHGGPITKEFLRRSPLPQSSIIDVRVHHLQAGQYPAIPGYHLDWIPRKDKGANPDMSRIPGARHVVMIIGLGSLTKFLAEEVTWDLPDEKPFERTTRYIEKYELPTWSVSNGQMVQFTSRDWHTATAATGPEWRLFIRASEVDRRPANEIRNFSQVYIPTQEASW
jgi:hypothetical protein